ncbi:hypothetical protein GGR42_003031 [Saonia flava]|uniref:Peptidase M56 domain-containing protein n=1 Tax=Saonia flava TaxID=523696 RepID=A0A846R054_9FLAO|nr:M56 family metallopeptidase [Saonia flava]NJB72540.1 hypothetical protein [Saonia flava]
MEYLLKASGVLLIFFIIYQLLLKKETFFSGNRHFLLAGILSSFIFPIVYVTRYVEFSSNTFYSDIVSTKNPVMTSTPILTGIDWSQLLFIIYCVGAGLLAFRLIIQLFSLRKLITQNTKRKEDGFVFVETTREITPFSFFNYIVYNPTLYSASELDAIIQHEKAHSSQWHSIDILLTHITTIIFWINPIIWLYKKSIQQNLEFLADAYATQDMSSIKTYQYALVKGSGTQFCTSITNNFYNSLIKKRIVMLHKSKSNNKNLWKYTLIAPMLVAFVFTFNIKVVAQSEKEIVEYVKKTELIITKDTSDEKLEGMKKDLAEGDIDFSYTVVHNDNQEIIGITIQVSSKTNNGSFNTDGETPIKPIKITIDNDQISIGNANTTFGGKSFNFTIHEDEDVHEDIDVHVDGEHEIIIKGHSSSTDDGMVWVHSSDSKHQTVEIKEIDGKEVIKVNGKVVSREDYEKMKDDGKMHNKLVKVKKKKGKKGNNVFIIKDSDDNHDIEVVGDDDSDFFFIDHDGEGEPLYIVDGKEVSKKEFKKLSKKDIATIDVSKGDAAHEKYGKKAKNGVVEIITKKKK